MKYTDNEMSIILLSSYLGISKEYNAKPLSLKEWNVFLERILQFKLEPAIVFNSDSSDLKMMGYDNNFIERIKKLVDRGAAVSVELLNYEEKGISVVTEINANYPKMLKRELKNKKPPILFYTGDLTLTQKVGIGVVGSRNVGSKGLDFIEELVKKAGKERLVVYSGGARGVDTQAENIAFDSGSAVISYISDSLISRIKKKDIETKIAGGLLVLLSDKKPDTSFSVARAMNRNKFIYASAYGTFVVESDYNKGGTWSGAVEAIKNNWGKVLVNQNNSEGNNKLIELGATPYSTTDEKLFDTILSIPKSREMEKTEYKQIDITSFMNQ